MIDEGISRATARTVRTFEAPTEAEAEELARSSVESFARAGWRIEEHLWIPGDRRPSLVESLVLSPQSENLLEATGTLRITFASDDPNATAPVVQAPERIPDTWEELGGVRYRRLAPRWIVTAAIGLLGLLIMAMLLSSAPGFATPTPDALGTCPVGFAPAYRWGDAQPTQVTCQRFP